MAVLINGNGNEAIYAQQDADWFASIMGNQTAITGIGNKFAASLLDANTIGVSDGVIITQEGRRIQLDVNEIDSFDIPAGGQGETNYYIIGYHLVTGDLSEQYCETFVRLMDNDTDTIPEDTFRGGADEVFVSLYRVTQDDLVITDMDLLLPEITNLSQLNTNLTELREEIPKMASPNLDFANPLHTFDNSHLTFTATKECYLLGSMNGNASASYGWDAKVNINSIPVYQLTGNGSTSGASSSLTVPLTKINSGDVVTITISNTQTASVNLHIFDVITSN